MNKFDQLVDDLTSGELTLDMIQIAIRTSIIRRRDLPEGIKNLLAGMDDKHLGCNGSGLIYQLYKPIQQVIGAMELAYRRGEDKP